MIASVSTTGVNTLPSGRPGGASAAATDTVRTATLQSAGAPSFADAVAALAGDGADLDAAVDEAAEDAEEEAEEEGGAGFSSFVDRGEKSNRVNLASGVALYARNVELFENSQQILGTRFDVVL
ncbi:MAG: hypothetical protein WD270_06690 [Acetobacterales bacterium]